MKNHFFLLVAFSLLLPPVTQLHAADDPPAPLSSAVKHDANVVADHAKDGAKQVAAAAKHVAHEVAAAAKQGAQEVAATAKRGAEKAKAAAHGDSAKPAGKPDKAATPAH